MRGNLLFIERGGGSIKGASSSSVSDRGPLSIQVGELSDFNDGLVNNLLMYLDERFERIGFHGSIYVEEDARGTGIGREIMAEFKSRAVNKTEMDFLFARIAHPQSTGFDLLEFYEKQGFEPVKYSNGEMLMVNKGHAAEIKRDVFGMFMDVSKDNQEENEY